jgi:hypothetical protein
MLGASEIAKALKIGRASVLLCELRREAVGVRWRSTGLKSEQRERRRKVRLDREHLEARSRRFLKIYLNAD